VGVGLNSNQTLRAPSTIARSLYARIIPTMRRILSLLALGLVGSGVGGMVFFFAAGWEGWTVMAAAAAVLVGALSSYRRRFLVFHGNSRDACSITALVARRTWTRRAV
jgi:hypothetical protein